MRAVLFIICVCVSITALGQNLSPTASKALIKFSVKDLKELPMKVDVFFYAVGSKETFKGHYNGKVSGEILIPNSEQYIMYTALSNDFFEFALSGVPNQVQQFPVQIDNSKAGELFSTPTWGLATFVVLNNKKEPQQVSLKVNGVNNDFTRFVKTDANGYAQLLLPNASKYSIDIDNAVGYTDLVISNEYFYVVDKLIEFESSEKLHPTQTMAVFNLFYHDLNDEPVEGEEFVVVSKTTGKEYKCSPTDTNGLGQVLVPIADSYTASAKYWKDFATHEVPVKATKYSLDVKLKYISSKAYEKWKKERDRQIARRDSIYEVERLAVEKQNRINDSLYEIKYEKWKKHNDSLLLAQKEFEDSLAMAYAREQAINDSLWKDQEIKNEAIVKENERRIKENELLVAQKEFKDSLAMVYSREQAINDSLWKDQEIKNEVMKKENERKVKEHELMMVRKKEQQDSIWAAREKSSGLLKEELSHFAALSSIRSIGTSLEDRRTLEKVLKTKFRVVKRAKEMKSEIEKDANFFKKEKLEVLAILDRMKEKWKNKTMVVDITGSMDKYWEQVLLWTVLKTNDEGSSQFVFFNDGDNKDDFRKKIGSTGGIYYEKSRDLNDIVSTILRGQKSSKGGDKEENDIESLLVGQKYKKEMEELILIADNYSDVRDMEILNRLNVPVRIVLCGVEGVNKIHEEYLTIAYQTKGSVHTIENDIEDLSVKMEKQKLKIGNGEYVLVGGRFVMFR